MKYRVICSFIIVTGLMLSATAYASPILITDVQYWLAPDHIQTIISFDRAAQPSYHHRTNPARFVVEIPNCEDIRGNETFLINDITLQRIRVQRLNNGTTQIVFDLSKKVVADVQILPRFNGQPDRVAITLFDSITQSEQFQQPQTTQPQPFNPVQPLPEHPARIVVLDPGHGGKDAGATGKGGIKEKDIVLDLATKMKNIIEANAPHVTVHLTRNDDTFLPLRKRTEIAEEYNADLFISLHVNANPSRKVHGFSIYTLSENATDQAARDLAEAENAADLLIGGVATPFPQDDSLLRFVLADLSTTASLQHSLEFGRMLVSNTVASLRQYDIAKEGLKRANFIVLRTAEMPAVLVEACYISNKKEATLLQQKEFRTQIAQSLAQSTIDYFAKMQNFMQPQFAQNSSVLLNPVDSGTAPTQYAVHVVKSGESLSVIAGRYNVKLAQLRQLNHLASADLIYVGQRLWIP